MATIYPPAAEPMAGQGGSVGQGRTDDDTVLQVRSEGGGRRGSEPNVTAPAFAINEDGQLSSITGAPVLLSTPNTWVTVIDSGIAFGTAGAGKNGLLFVGLNTEIDLNTALAGSDIATFEVDYSLDNGATWNPIVTIDAMAAVGTTSANPFVTPIPVASSASRVVALTAQGVRIRVRAASVAGNVIIVANGQDGAQPEPGPAPPQAIGTLYSSVIWPVM